jgi:Lar family restriction alleviation protein
MGRQIIKQPNGKYAIWSTIIDNFLYYNITKEEYFKIRIEEEIKHVREDLNDYFDELENGKSPYHQLTFDEALIILKHKGAEIPEDLNDNVSFDPCPFCGNDEEKKIYIIPEKDQDLGSIGGYYVECGGCDATGSFRPTQEEAIKYWNNAAKMSYEI